MRLARDQLCERREIDCAKGRGLIVGVVVFEFAKGIHALSDFEDGYYKKGGRC